MEKLYREAFTEVDEIFKIMPIDLLSKIPAQFRKIISENKAKDYKAIIEEPLEEKNLRKETVVILGLIYRDFLASPEEREELQRKDAEELKKIEQELQEQYDMQNVFEKRKNGKKSENIEDSLQYSTDLTLYKEPGFFRKVLDFFKGFFKKNKI